MPAIDGALAEEYGQKAGDLGLVPSTQKAFDESDKGTVFRVEPEPGTEVKAGTPVKLFVSSGFPELAYDNDKDVLRVNGSDGSKLDPIAKGSQDEHDPAWSADGSAVAYTSEGQIFLADLSKPDEAPKELTKKGEKFSDLAWAPPADVNVLAMAKIVDGASDLCLGKIDADGMTTTCKEEPDITIERKINWAPDGKSILAWGFKTGTTKFGMVRWKTEEPFSTNPADYSAGKIMTDTTKPGEGVLDAAISPDGKQMAIVNLGANGLPELLPREARRLPALRREGARRARLQGDLAAGRQGARGRPRRRLLRLGDRRADPGAARQPEGPALAQAQRRQPGLPAFGRGVGPRTCCAPTAAAR